MIYKGLYDNDHELRRLMTVFSITHELIDILEGWSGKTCIGGRDWGAHKAHDIQTMYY